MNKKIIKLFSGLLIVIFTLHTLMPFSYAQWTCWNDAKLILTTGGASSAGKEQTPTVNPLGSHTGADPVNLATGNFDHNHQDFLIPTRGIPLELTRIYNSLDNQEGPFGIGWSHNYNIFLLPISENGQSYILRRNADSAKDNFLLNPDGSYTSTSAGCYDRLTKSETAYIIETKHKEKYTFDLSGKLIELCDRNLNKLTLTYDAQNRLTRVADEIGRKIDFTYNAENKITSATDFSGRTTTYQYTQGDLTSITTPATEEYPSGLATGYNYDSSHRIIAITDAKNNTYLRNYFDADGRVVEQDYGMHKFFFTYNYNVTTFTDRNGFTTIYFHNLDGSVAKKEVYTSGMRINEPAKYTTTYEYNSNKQITKLTSPGGNALAYEYDALGNQTKITQLPKEGSAEQPIVTIFTYDAGFNFVKTITDPKANVTTYDYDTKGNVIGITYPAADGQNPATTFTYNEYGQIATAVSPNSIVTKYEYDTVGHLAKLTRDFGGASHKNIITLFTTDPLGNVTAVTDVLGNTTNFTYNALDQLVKTITAGPFNYQTFYYYDENSNLKKLKQQADNAGQTWVTTEYEYNLLDKLTRVKQYLNADTTLATLYDYDGNENTAQITDAEGNSTHYLYDERGLLYKAIDAQGSITEYVYTENGSLSGIKDANNNETTYEYDDFGRLVKTNYPDLSYEAYTYDANSNLLTKRTRKGDTVYYEYDPLNRMREKGLSPKGNYPDSVHTYTYDIASRLAAAANTNATISYEYDSLDRVTKTTQLTGRTTQYEYDSLGNRAKLIYPDSSFITYTYDQLNRLTAIKDAGSANITSYTYDALSRRTQLDYANNTNAAYVYDNLSRLTTLTNTTNSTNKTLNYTYDKVGNKKTKTETGGTTAYDYDPIYQLTQVTDPQSQATNYSYDALGNRTTAENKSYTSNNLNQYTQIDTNNFTYDQTGNLTSDTTWTYGYDYENRLTTASNGATNATYTYDSFGRRTSKDTTHNATHNTQYYIYDGDQLIAEYDEGGTLTATYIYSTGIDEPLCTRIIASGSEAIYYYHFDGLGSITELTNTSGATIETYTYDPYGTTTIKDPSNNTITQSTIGNRYAFTGRELDTETGLYFYRARYYSPTQGRFLQPDPIGYYDSLNLYQYVNNNPLNYFDPFGEDVYLVNFSLFLNKETGYYNLFSHTYPVTTNGTTVEHTYSWGEKGFKKKWVKDDPRDIEIAQRAIDKNLAMKIGTEDLERYLDLAYTQKQNEDIHLWWLWNNCKHEAKELLEEAINEQKKEIQKCQKKEHRKLKKGDKCK